MEAPVYKEVKVVTEVGYELYVNPAGSKYLLKDGVLHCEDGPAYVHSSGVQRWYLNDTNVPEKEFKEVWECPLDKLPLYINTIYAPIAKRRLSNPKEVLNG